MHTLFFSTTKKKLRVTFFDWSSEYSFVDSFVRPFPPAAFVRFPAPRGLIRTPHPVRSACLSTVPLTRASPSNLPRPTHVSRRLRRPAAAPPFPPPCAPPASPSPPYAPPPAGPSVPPYAPPPSTSPTPQFLHSSRGARPSKWSRREGTQRACHSCRRGAGGQGSGPWIQAGGGEGDAAPPSELNSRPAAQLLHSGHGFSPYLLPRLQLQRRSPARRQTGASQRGGGLGGGSGTD